MTQVNEPSRHQVTDAFVPLPDAMHSHQPGLQQGQTLALCHLWPNNYVDDAGFVFEAHKNDTIGGLSALPHGDQSTDSCQSPIRMSRKLGGARERLE